MHLCLAKASFGLVPFLAEFAVGGAAKARPRIIPGLIAGLIAALRLPDAAHCSGVSPVCFTRRGEQALSLGQTRGVSHCWSYVFLLSVAY